MRQYECRIALRLGEPERERLERLIFERKFRNLSQAIRAAIAEYLDKQQTESSDPTFSEVRR